VLVFLGIWSMGWEVRKLSQESHLSVGDTVKSGLCVWAACYDAKRSRKAELSTAGNGYTL